MNELSTETTIWHKVHPEIGMTPMDRLFERIEGALPGKWRASFKSAADIDNWRIVWASAFDYHKITPQEIKTGLANLCDRVIAKQHMDGWIPTCGEFIALCRHKQRHIPCCALPKKLTPEDKVKGRAELEKIKEMRKASRFGRTA